MVIGVFRLDAGPLVSGGAPDLFRSDIIYA